MAAKAYQDKVLHILIQDLAERWLNDATNPRSLRALPNGQLQQIARNITKATGEPITAKTLRNYVQGGVGDRAQCRDYIAAAWLAATEFLENTNIQRFTGSSEGRFNHCVEVFKERKRSLMDGLSQHEGVTLEYKEKLPPVPELADLLCAFANTSGGLVVLGVDGKEGDYHAIGLTGEEPAIYDTEAALRRLSPKEHVSLLNIQYGWSYVQERIFPDETGDKLLYFIQVPDNATRGVLVKSTGIAYRRKGTHNRPIEENEPTLRGALCLATNARRKLIHNYRSILSLTAAVQTLSERDSNTLTVLSLSSIAATFTTYLADIIEETHHKLTQDPHLLATVKEVTAHTVEQLRIGRVEDFLIAIRRDLPTIFDILHAERQTILRVFQLARIWDRNAGVTDEEFVAALGGDLHSVARIAPTDISVMVFRLNAIAKAIDRALNAKHKLAEQEVEELAGP